MSSRLVRVSEEVFRQMMGTATSEVEVDWGEPVDLVLVKDSETPGWAHYHEEPVYEPVLRRHFTDDLDEPENIYAEDFGESWVP